MLSAEEEAQLILQSQERDSLFPPQSAFLLDVRCKRCSCRTVLHTSSFARNKRWLGVAFRPWLRRACSWWQHWCAFAGVRPGSISKEVLLYQTYQSSKLSSGSEPRLKPQLQEGDTADAHVLLCGHYSFDKSRFARAQLQVQPAGA